MGGETDNDWDLYPERESRFGGRGGLSGGLIARITEFTDRYPPILKSVLWGRPLFGCGGCEGWRKLSWGALHLSKGFNQGNLVECFELLGYS